MSKYEEEAKKDISKRLQLSNKALWNSISEKDQRSVVDLYFDLRSIDSMGIHKILEENASLRRDLGLLVFALLLGVFGNVVADRLVKYLPATAYFDVYLFFGFIALTVGLVYLVRMSSVENLAGEHVLEHLLERLNNDRK